MTVRNQHTFVVPAYRQSPHLRDCLASLREQTLPSSIVISTSTPFLGLEALAMEYGAGLVIHSPNVGIGHDWNHALSKVKTDWTTIAHQDDVYLPDFAEKTLAAISRHPDARLVMTGYGELVGEQVRTVTPMLLIKHLLLESGFLGRSSIAATKAKRRLLRFGCAIPCPSVTLRLSSEPLRFREDMKLNLDWDAWLRLAEREGEFVRIRETLMLHRIHTESETSDGIRAGVRSREDLMMFRALWPRPIAHLLARMYALSYQRESKK